MRDVDEPSTTVCVCVCVCSCVWLCVYAMDSSPTLREDSVTWEMPP
jgi:hypothetical protein